MGEDRKCYVLDASGTPKERDIKVGRSNDTMVEIVSGVEEGEIVALDPRGALIPKDSGMIPGTPTKTKGARWRQRRMRGWQERVAAAIPA